MTPMATMNARRCTIKWIDPIWRRRIGRRRRNWAARNDTYSRTVSVRRTYRTALLASIARPAETTGLFMVEVSERIQQCDDRECGEENSAEDQADADEPVRPQLAREQ